MHHRWITLLNYLIGGCACLFLVAASLIWLLRAGDVEYTAPMAREIHLPKCAFELTADAYEEINGPLLELQSSPPTLQVPDMRQLLLYYGKNGRPDAKLDNTMLHFGFSGNKQIGSAKVNEPLYLVYDKKSSPPKYVFSPNNAKSSLWIEASVAETEAIVKVGMVTDKGVRVLEPEQNVQFRLPEKELLRNVGATWEIGTYRVDGTLLARQRARWYGPDKFLERHGGDEYSEVLGKQRIDFGENEELYSVFMKPGDSLIWNQNQWKVVDPSVDSSMSPMLVLKKLDERLMNFELWDVDGKGKVTLNLLKSTEPWVAQNAQNIQQMFKFLGAKTRSQYVFELNQERVTLRPSDWLLLTTKGWQKLETVEEIDNYVKRKTTGVLFVFEGVRRKGDHQVMMGSIFNPTRSDYQPVEMDIQETSSHKGSKSKDNNDAKEFRDMAKSEREKASSMSMDDDEDRAPSHHQHVPPHQNASSPHVNRP